MANRKKLGANWKFAPFSVIVIITFNVITCNCPLFIIFNTDSPDIQVILPTSKHRDSEGEVIHILTRPSAAYLQMMIGK